MSRAFKKFQKYRLLTSYLSVVISISLMLFLFGMIRLLVLNVKSITDHFKEQTRLTVFVNDKASAIDITHLQQSLVLKDYTKAVSFVSKDQAAKTLTSDIGEDFVAFLGKNPLYNAVDVQLKAQYVTQNDIEKINESISALPYVLEVSYDKLLIGLLNKNTRKMSLYLLIASGVFGVIVLLLINTSIRLSIYAQRFVIKTMQLVGASKSFIRRPFIAKHVKLGMIGATLATIAIGLLLYYVDARVPEVNLMNPVMLLEVCLEIFAVGIIMTWLSTFVVAQRFLNLQTDNLY